MRYQLHNQDPVLFEAGEAELVVTGTPAELMPIMKLLTEPKADSLVDVLRKMTAGTISPAQAAADMQYKPKG